MNNSLDDLDLSDAVVARCLRIAKARNCFSGERLAQEVATLVVEYRRQAAGAE